MATGKWINDLSADTPLHDAARRVMGVRLEVVRNCLGLAVREPEKDIEYVHQLRVGTRRSRAALDIFASCLPAKIHKAARRWLRDIRRAAGEARDWDVFLVSLHKEIKQQREANQAYAGLDCLVGYAFSQRLAAQQVLRQAAPDPFVFDRFYADLLYAVRPANGNDNVLLDLARPVLQQLLQEMDEAAGDLSNYDRLHQVRLVGKRLRYAMEVFAGCFPDEFRKVYYRAIEEMQETLGRANDSHVADERLGALAEQMQALIPNYWERYQADLDRLLAFHRERLPKEKVKFEEQWRRWQNDADGKAGLLALLKSTTLGE